MGDHLSVAVDWNDDFSPPPRMRHHSVGNIDVLVLSVHSESSQVALPIASVLFSTSLPIPTGTCSAIKQTKAIHSLSLMFSLTCKTSDNLHHRQRCKHFAVSILITVLVIISSGVFTKLFATGNPQYEFDPPELQPGTPYINILSDFLSVDVDAGTFTTDWFVYTDNCSTSDYISFPDNVVDIYIDPNLLVDSSNDFSAVRSDSTSSTVIFRFSNQGCNNNPRSSNPSFRTISKLASAIDGVESKRGRGGTLEFYPFDTYFVFISLFAQIEFQNATYDVSIRQVAAGIPVNFNLELNANAKNTVNGLKIILDISRSNVVRVFVIVVVIANWIVTVAFLWITVASTIWEEHIVKEMFVVPVAVLFAFTSVRGNMPGAPSGFGAIVDFIGILPNIAIITICSATLLIVVLIQRTKTPYLERYELKVRKKTMDDAEQAIPSASGAAEEVAINEVVATSTNEVNTASGTVAGSRELDENETVSGNSEVTVNEAVPAILNPATEAVIAIEAIHENETVVENEVIPAILNAATEAVLANKAIPENETVVENEVIPAREQL